MIRVFEKIFRVPDLRRGALFAALAVTLAVAVYRAGFYVPQPGIDQSKLAHHLQQAEGGDELHAILLSVDEVSRP